MMPPVYDQLVGVCVSGDHDATEWSRENGDVIGYLLGHDAAGWWLVDNHVSSDPSFSEYDIGYHRAQRLKDAIRGTAADMDESPVSRE